MKTGIYCIEHIASGKKYVGSAVDFIQRWAVHLNRLRRGLHHSPTLQNAWDKYGEDAFEFKKLLVCSKENLLMYEQLCIDGYAACDRAKGFNISPTAGSNLGVRASDITKAKMSATRRARQGPHTEATKEKMRAAWARRENRSLPKEQRLALRALRAHKLDATKAEEIRARVAAGESTKDVALAYGLKNRNYVNDIVRGVRWGPIE